MPLLESVNSPASLRLLDPDRLPELAAEIRRLLVERVCSTGGHLGPNLGVVELTIALHTEFASPRDRILFDTGHQAYVHKILTGRAAGLHGLRQRGGLSGYPSRAESVHDTIENSHASTALGYADGLARAYALLGERDRHVVAVVGDGALTGGMAWEALNNIAAARHRNLVIVLNDNGRSYAPTVGGLAEHLARLRTAPPGPPAAPVAVPEAERPSRSAEPAHAAGRFDGVQDPDGSDSAGADSAGRGPDAAGPGPDAAGSRGFFADLGLTYLGPYDGHDITALCRALRQARATPGPVLVHCVTRKGAGYPPAEAHEADRFHGIGVLDPVTGRAPTTGRAQATGGRSWTSVFAQELAVLGAERPDLVAITAAMRAPVGLEPFAAAFPDRVFDVGIAEQHAVVSAAGLSIGGLHPVVAVYATFLNRAFDQVLMDAALHRTGITLVLDRAGVTGEDGASHHGIWDLSVLQAVPGLRIAAPRDAATLRAELREAVAVHDAPTVVRYPKGTVPAEVPAAGRCGGADVLRLPDTGGQDVLLVAVGAMSGVCLGAAGRLAADGLGVTVVDPRWVKPLDPALVALAAEHRLVVTVEDGVVAGGVGAALGLALRRGRSDVPLRTLGIPHRFLEHGSRTELLESIGLTDTQVAATVRAEYAALPAGQAPAAADLVLAEGAR